MILGQCSRDLVDKIEGDEDAYAGSLEDDDELIGALGLVWAYSDELRLRVNVSEGYVYPSLTSFSLALSMHKLLDGLFAQFCKCSDANWV